MKTNLTGNRDVDYLFLDNLNDYYLGQICKLNQYTRNLCKNETFWKNRTIKRFTPVFGNYETINDYREKYGYNSWRDYYISLVDSMQKYFTNAIYFYSKENRDDTMLLLKYIYENTKKYVTCYRNNEYNCSLKWLEEDLINLNQIFDIASEKKNLQNILLILNLPFFTINYDNIEKILSNFNDISILLEKRNNYRIRKIILEFLLINSKYGLNALLTYIENGNEILDALFMVIINGNRIPKKTIKKYLDAAIEKGSTKSEIKQYYDLSRGLGKELDDVEEENYEDNLKNVRKYLKRMK